ncbi:MULTISPECIES: DUF3558 domain-containing protein [unclassified Streptomyces]|uniref:DUF3558 domain-containing protein n=1 Tax=unclassified Streptomyces TaxID=2593676 RepID=UPI000DADC299|nr:MULTISPECIES: DUF3558 domain-containing protein [unclassified Streptomyces]PZT72460.1 DUF3558 domain-containing protein [Streptomyces sp. AC1-42T]PZT81221.1 DUF3558 domain-containing protein [Streptomyces sp. AC1-42W]
MAYATGAVLIAALAAGCTGGGGADDPGADDKPGIGSESPAPPGKYRTLPDACRAIPRATLKDLLPGTADLPEAQQDKAFEGAATVTYDTDRRIGCRWKSDAPQGTRGIHLDFERVVSYDTSVSDDDRAREVYAKKEGAADLPAPTLPDESPDASPSGSDTADPGDTDTGTPDDDPTDGSDGTGTPGGPASDGPADSLQPRLLDGLGDSAFLDDVLTRSGSTARYRTVSVVFRTSNVIVTVEYTAQPALPTEVPDSAELQEKAQALARQLVDSFDE